MAHTDNKCASHDPVGVGVASLELFGSGMEILARSSDFVLVRAGPVPVKIAVSLLNGPTDVIVGKPLLAPEAPEATWLIKPELCAKT